MMRKKKHHFPPKSSSLETRTEAFLLSINVSFERQFKLEGRYYDFFLPDHNLLLEIHGDYWHALDYHNKTKKWLELYAAQKRSVRVDAKKICIARRHGYALHVIWEHELDEQLQLLIGVIEEGHYTHPARTIPLLED